MGIKRSRIRAVSRLNVLKTCGAAQESTIKHIKRHHTPMDSFATKIRVICVSLLWQGIDQKSISSTNLKYVQSMVYSCSLSRGSFTGVSSNVQTGEWKRTGDITKGRESNVCAWSTKPVSSPMSSNFLWSLSTNQPLTTTKETSSHTPKLPKKIKLMLSMITVSHSSLTPTILKLKKKLRKNNDKLKKDGEQP